MKLDKGELHIDLDEIIQNMSEEQLRELAQTAVFQESLLNGVCGALTDSHMFEDYWWWGGDTFQKLREKLLPLMPEVCKEAIIQLTLERDRARLDKDEILKASWKLQDAWQDAKMPDEVRYRSMKFTPRMTKEQAAEYIKELEEKVNGVKCTG